MNRIHKNLNKGLNLLLRILFLEKGKNKNIKIALNNANTPKVLSGIALKIV